MSSYRPTLTPPADLDHPRFLCGSCGVTRPIVQGSDDDLIGPAWPVCGRGARMSMVHADNLAYVGSPSERLDTAQREYDEAYAGWRRGLCALRRSLDEEAEATPLVAYTVIHNWRGLERDAEGLSHLAAGVDRVEREVGEC